MQTLVQQMTAHATQSAAAAEKLTAESTELNGIVSRLAAIVSGTDGGGATARAGSEP
jgi:methyl-accepting chemotaxis protein